MSTDLSPLEAVLYASPTQVPDIRQRVAHNKAVTAFVKERVGVVASLRSSERGILALIAGLDQLVGSWSASHDPFMAEQIHGITLHAHSLLNYDTGRLLGSVLSDALRSLCERSGADADTGEWVGGA